MELSMSMFASREDYERAKFEAWWDKHNATPAYPNEDGSYTRSTVSLAWAAWQARERLRAEGKDAELYERDGTWFVDEIEGHCIAAWQCRCKGLEIEQRQGCEEWVN